MFVIGFWYGPKLENGVRYSMSERLEDIAIAMVANGKGLLAADESTATIKKRFDTIGLESTADSRRDYREMLFRPTRR